MKANNPAGLLASLLSGLSTGAVKVVELEIDPNRPIEDQLDEVGEKIAAAHREQCPACREEYEAEQAKSQAEAKAPSRGVRDELAEKLKARHEAELAELAERHAIERAGLDESKPGYHEIGFMAFYGGRAIPNSFDMSRKRIESLHEVFCDDPFVVSLNRMMGVKDMAAIEIRPVYARRED